MKPQPVPSTSPWPLHSQQLQHTRTYRVSGEEPVVHFIMFRYTYRSTDKMRSPVANHKPFMQCHPHKKHNSLDTTQWIATPAQYRKHIRSLKQPLSRKDDLCPSLAGQHRLNTNSPNTHKTVAQTDSNITSMSMFTTINPPFSILHSPFSLEPSEDQYLATQHVTREAHQYPSKRWLQ